MLDRDGLQVAFLGVALAHYLDLETGEVLDLPLEAPPPGGRPRYLRVPTRTSESDLEDRRLFVERLDFTLLRDRLANAVEDGRSFRTLLAEDRRVERAFFNFKNDRASEAIERWLEGEGLG